MGKCISAVVFPGQGTQKTGMGKDFYDSIPESRAIYEQASDTLGWNIPVLCFDQNNRINLTELAQPLILTTEMAMIKGLQKEFGFSPDFFGGHSLGEYTALVAAEVISFTDAVQIVYERGKLMQQASPEGTGGMTAVIATKIDVEIVKNCLHDLEVDIANINSVDQIVLSGDKQDLRVAENRIKNAMSLEDSLRFVSLNVSAPFHSRMMRPIANVFKAVLEDAFDNNFDPALAGRVTSNFTGAFHPKDKETIMTNLVSQLSGTVKWCDNMKKLTEQADAIFEIGPNRPLRSFFATIGKQCNAVTTLRSAKRVFEVNDEKHEKIHAK